MLSKQTKFEIKTHLMMGVSRKDVAKLFGVSYGTVAILDRSTRRKNTTVKFDKPTKKGFVKTGKIKVKPVKNIELVTVDEFASALSVIFNRMADEERLVKAVANKAGYASERVNCIDTKSTKRLSVAVWAIVFYLVLFTGATIISIMNLWKGII